MEVNKKGFGVGEIGSPPWEAAGLLCSGTGGGRPRDQSVAIEKDA